MSPAFLWLAYNDDPIEAPGHSFRRGSQSSIGLAWGDWPDGYWSISRTWRHSEARSLESTW